MKATGDFRSKTAAESTGTMLQRFLLATCATLLIAQDAMPRSQFFFGDAQESGSSVVDGSEFVFARLMYGSGRAGLGNRGAGWL